MDFSKRKLGYVFGFDAEVCLGMIGRIFFFFLIQVSPAIQKLSIPVKPFLS